MKKILIITAVIVLFVGCASCNNTEQNKTNLTKENVVLKKPVKQGLPPGSALISATLLEDKGNKSPEILLVKVNKVLQYGHSTPALANGEKIYLRIKHKNLINKLDINTSQKLLIKHSLPQIGNDNSIEWILSNIQ